VMPNNPRPYDISADQLAKVKEWLFKLRPQIVSFSPQNQGLVSALVNEDAIITPYGDMDIEMTVAGYDNFKSTVPKEGSIRWTEAACLCADSKNKELALKWIDYMSTAKVQSKLVYTKGFKARAPNTKIVDHWDADQKKLMKYIPDPASPGKTLVDTFTETVPANTTFVSLTQPAGWLCSTPAVGGTGTITCTAATFASGANTSNGCVGTNDFSGGTVATTTTVISTAGVANAAPAAVYQSERYGVFTYTLPGFAAGSSHSVRLHFAEIYWTAAGSRVFNVSINGTAVLSNLDIFATAGGANKALVEQFTTTANSSGQIVVDFTNGSADQPKISGIEVQ